MKFSLIVHDVPEGHVAFFRREDAETGETRGEDTVLVADRPYNTDVVAGEDLRVFVEPEAGHAEQDAYLRSGE